MPISNISKNIKWSVDFNGTFQKNRLIELALYEGVDFLLFGDNQKRNYQILEEGKAFGNFVGYETDGLYQTQAEIDGSAQHNSRPSDIKYVDQNGDGTISKEDFVVLGNAYPDFFGGLTNNFSFNNFELSIFLFSMIGQDMFNWDSFLGKYGLDATEYNKYKEVATERWTGPGTSNDIPRAGYKPVNVTDGPDGAIDILIEDASFIRLRDVTLTYNLPVQLISKLGFKSIKVYVKGNNLLTITNYSGADPEANQMQGSTTLLPMGIAYYPALKTYMVGLNLGF